MPAKTIRRELGTITAATVNTLSALAPWPTASRGQHNDWPLVSARLAHEANDNAATAPLEKHYTLREVAASWGISLSTLYREIDDGNLVARKVRGQWRVTEFALADYGKTWETALRLPGDRRTCRNAP